MKSIKEFIPFINALRLKGGWYYWQGTVADKTVIVKGYGTWLQRYTVAGIEYGNSCDRKVSEFKADLAKPF